MHYNNYTQNYNTMSEKCLICGATISENNTTGIGFGCMGNVVLPALKEWRYHAHGLDLWAKKCELVMNLFKETFGSRKFRNQFKKDFSASIIQQWETNKKLSKKQLDICSNMLEQNHVFFNFESIYKGWFEKLYPFDSDEFYSERIKFHRDLYLKGRKNRKKED